MAIQIRRGDFSDFDPDKLLPGEWACVASGDPNSDDGQSIYICYAVGTVKRMATYEDMVRNVENATDDIRAAFLSAIELATESAESATTAATNAAQLANEAAQSANEAAEAVGEAVSGVINDSEASSLTAYSSQLVENSFLKKTGDSSNTTSTYEESDQETVPISGSKLSVLFGWLIKKGEQIGDILSLSTTEKSNIVDAINEINTGLSGLNTAYYNDSKTQSIPDRTTTQVYNVQLQPGTYLITCDARGGLSDADAGFVMSLIVPGFAAVISRGTLLDGGGLCISKIYELSTVAAIAVFITHTHGSSVDVTAGLSYIKLR